MTTITEPKYPTRGIELIVPTIVETEITGWVFTANFTRRGQDYSARYNRCGWSIERNGEAIKRWDDLPVAAQKILIKAKANYAA